MKLILAFHNFAKASKICRYDSWSPLGIQPTYLQKRYSTVERYKQTQPDQSGSVGGGYVLHSPWKTEFDYSNVRGYVRFALILLSHNPVRTRVVNQAGLTFQVLVND
jgi:hypothetical protein